MQHARDPIDGGCGPDILQQDGELISAEAEDAGSRSDVRQRGGQTAGSGGEHLAVVDQDEPLAQYCVAYQPDQRRLQLVTPEPPVETPHRSSQPALWTWGEDEWLPVLRLPAYAPRKSRPPGAVQPPLFALEEVSA